MSLSRKILIAAGIVFVLAILISVVHHYQLRFAVANYVAELKAKGEPMELAQVIPPSVSPEKNSALLFWKAVALFTTNDDVLTTNWPTAMHGITPGKAIVSWAQSEIRDEDSTNSWTQLQEALARNREAFKLLNQITNNAAFDFNLQYTQRFEMTITNLIFEKKSAQKLSADAIYDLHVGDAISAAKNVRTILALVNGTGDERTVISQLVRIAIAQIAAADTWELLQSTNLTDESLAELQKSWLQLEFIQALERALPLEREGALTMVAKWRNSNSELQHYFDLKKRVKTFFGNDDEEDSLWKNAKLKTVIFLWRYWWSYPDELRYLKGYDVLANAAKSAETNGFYQTALQYQNSELERLGISKLDDEFATLFSGETDFHSMLSESIVTLGNVTRKVMQVEVARQTAIAAIALKRHQLKHGNYPKDLDSLVPEFLSAVPLDPVDGKPLRYKLNADGTFLLYSIGENGMDDGGNPAPEKNVESSNFFWQYPNALDWVWPQPATEEEVQAYYKKISSQSN
ncbi:MAG TPA: hypothetical protein VHG89_13185 [Verrucomicrobiae bacterium]|nr:hypothetical protein [Verrucomicrobiae bacterium]